MFYYIMLDMEITMLFLCGVIHFLIFVIGMCKRVKEYTYFENKVFIKGLSHILCTVTIATDDQFKGFLLDYSVHHKIIFKFSPFSMLYNTIYSTFVYLILLTHDDSKCKQSGFASCRLSSAIN